MANIAPSLSPLDITRAPEGGEIGAVQSGWRLAFREFAKNKLAVAGMAYSCSSWCSASLGPLFYHGNITSSDLLHTSLPPGSRLPARHDRRQGFDELGLLMKGGQAALEVGFAPRSSAS